MTTIVLKLTVAQAQKLARVCDREQLAHHEFCRLAVLLALKAASE